MKIYILTQVNGYAELLSLTPFKTKEAAKAEMERQFKEEMEDEDYEVGDVDYEDNDSNEYFIDDKHAEIVAEDNEWSYSWDITVIDTDKIK